MLAVLSGGLKCPCYGSNYELSCIHHCNDCVVVFLAFKNNVASLAESVEQ